MRTRAIACIVAGLVSATLASEAKAVDLPKVGGSPVRLEVTETSVFAQRFNARQGEKEWDQGYFAWLNRLNVVLSWKEFTFGARLDSSLYALRPEDRQYSDQGIKDYAVSDGASRYRDAIYPAKLYLTYKKGIVEATAGDSYIQFGRGLVLSMRKLDELGIDNTLFGGKLTLQSDPFSFTVAAGLANPARVDEPTGRALFLPKPIPNDSGSPQPLFGSDRIVAAQIQAGRGLPVVASTQAVMLNRCAPYRYNADGSVQKGLFDAPFGTCDDTTTQQWAETWPPTPPAQAKRTINASQSIEVPNLWGHGNFYVEAAVQKREYEDGRTADTEGNAVYGSLTNTGGPITNTLEMKSYRNFYPLQGSVNVSSASAFSNITYSAPPTAEVVTQDSMFGFFNTCVTGGRDRLDYRVNNNALFWGALGYFVTRSETPGGYCDKQGRSTNENPEKTTNSVVDISAGTQLQWDDDKSIAFLTATYRNDTKDNGDLFYREYAFQYSITKHITGPYALEVAGRHRRRREDHQNIRGDDLSGEPWSEGDNQVALKVAPKWIFSQGFEYTTFTGLPTYYLNGGVVYRFTSQSNIRIFGGQNRGGLRCVSGICRFFPAFSGARVELTLRF